MTQRFICNWTSKEEPVACVVSGGENLDFQTLRFIKLRKINLMWRLAFSKTVVVSTTKYKKYNHLLKIEKSGFLKSAMKRNSGTTDSIISAIMCCNFCCNKFGVGSYDIYGIWPSEHKIFSWEKNIRKARIPRYAKTSQAYKLTNCLP